MIAKSFTIGMLIVGAILGAGFASGAELISFFGLDTSPIVVAVLVTVLVFLVSCLFLFLGNKVNKKTISLVNQKVYGKFFFLADAFLLVNSLIILSAMLAATNSLGASIFSSSFSPLYAVIIGVICATVSIKGKKGLITANKFVSPIMIAVLVFIGLFISITATGGRGVSFNAGTIWVVIIYVSMNMMLAATVVTTLGKLNKKIIFLSSGIAAASMGLLVFVLMTALNRYGYVMGSMPTLDMARYIHPAIFWTMALALAAGIFTTILTAMTGLVAWFEGVFGGKIFSAFTVLAAGFILSNLGFSTVITLLYPIIGIVGLVYILFASIYSFKKTKFIKPLTNSNQKNNKIKTRKTLVQR